MSRAAFSLVAALAGGALTSTAPGETDRTQAGERTALDRYVAVPDPSFAWKKVQSVPLDGATLDVIELISQSWLTAAEVDKPVWKHWLNIIRPATVEHHTAMLFIGGGSNDKPAPDKPDDNLLKIAKETHSVVAELKGVPSQPLVFSGETKGRSEDEIIALTWDKFLHTGDEKWPARLPMTKAAVRAMDTITAFCASPDGGGAAVEKFFVAGGSKRGWTTWTTAAVDRRVVAIAPLVIDVLNVGAALVNHWESYGFWAPAVGDYTEMRLMDWYGTPEFARLMKIEDPWEYRSRLSLPKFIINAAGDQFFPPDSSHFYFDGLPGVKYLRYVPNTNHGLKGSDAWLTLLACYDGILRSAALPQFQWTSAPDGHLSLTCDTPPDKVLLWTATNEKARDFRLESLGPQWKSDLLPADPVSPKSFTATVPKPAAGWTAWFVELTFPTGRDAPWKFTTGVQITPDTRPHKFKAPPLRR